MAMIEIENENLPLTQMIEIDVGRSLGVTAEVYIKEAARKLPEYNTPLNTWQVGHDLNNNEIAVNSLGRWLFGVPGFSGHSRISTNGNKINVHYPNQPPEILQLLHSLKNHLELAKVN